MFSYTKCNTEKFSVFFSEIPFDAKCLLANFKREICYNMIW